MIRIAAVGDVHVDKDVVGRYRPACEELPDRADALLIAGDLTRHGTVDEAKCFATEFGGLGVPVVVVLGNHDHQSDRQDEVTRAIEDAGITVLEGSTTVLELHGHRLGIAGTKGFGGGFAGACASNFGEREMKDFVATTERYATGLGEALRSLECKQKQTRKTGDTEIKPRTSYTNKGTRNGNQKEHEGSKAAVKARTPERETWKKQERQPTPRERRRTNGEKQKAPNQPPTQKETHEGRKKAQNKRETNREKKDEGKLREQANNKISAVLGETDKKGAKGKKGDAKPEKKAKSKKGEEAEKAPEGEAAGEKKEKKKKAKK